MNDELSKSEKFLLEEYHCAERLSLHIDDVRSRVIMFFLTFSGIVAAGLLAYVKGELSLARTFDSTGLPPNPIGILSVLVLLAGVLATTVLFILARLRRAQLERLRIMSNIRQYFLGQDNAFWNIVELAPATLPTPNRKSGSYGWALLVIWIGAYFLSFGIHLIIHAWLHLVELRQAYVIDTITFIISIVCLDQLYMRAAQAPVRPTYSADY